MISECRILNVEGMSRFAPALLSGFFKQMPARSASILRHSIFCILQFAVFNLVWLRLVRFGGNL